MKTLSASAIAEKKKKTGAQAVALVEIDADSPGTGTTDTKYYASRKTSFDSQTYRDLIRPGGLQMGWMMLRHGGGLAQPITASMSVANQGLESNLADDYFLDNDAVRLYWLFITGSEVAADKVPMGSFVIEDHPFDENEFTVRFKDDSDKDFKDFPIDVLNLADHPDAPLDDLGLVVPVAFGDFQTDPHAGTAESAMLAPCRCTDIFLRKYTSGLHNNTYGNLFQYYPAFKRWAQVVFSTESGGIMTITNEDRRMFIVPTHTKATNDVTNWQKAANLDSSSTVSVGTSDNLDMVFGGMNKVGKMTSLILTIEFTGGTCDYEVFYDAVSLVSGSSASSTTVNLDAHITTYFTETWELERLSVELGATGSAVVYSQVYLKMDFDDEQSSEREALDIYQDVEGWEDLVAKYNDGLVVSSSGIALVNPVHQLEAVFRAKTLLNMATAKVRSWATAATARTAWTFAFSLDRQVRADWIDTFAFEAGLHIFKDVDGKFHCVAMDKTAAALHYFGTDYNIAVRNPGNPPREWRIDCRLGRTPVSQIINEVILGYRKDAASGQHKALRAASSHYRVTGAIDTVVAATGVLTDATADFVNDGVVVNDRCYLEGDSKDCIVSAVTATTLTLTAETGSMNNYISGSYYVGPSVNGAMIRSQQRYKTVNPLGDTFNPFTGEGGYKSDLIDTDATAKNFIDHISDWRAERRLTAEFNTFLRAVDVELGDPCLFDHPALPVKKRPRLLGTLNGAHTDSVTTLTMTAATVVKMQSGDLLRIGTEIVSVTSVDYGAGTAVIVRGQLNTDAAAHNSGVSVFQMGFCTWYVVGIKPLFRVGDYPYVRLKLEEMPNNYQYVGECSATGYGDYETKTLAQQLASGWASWPNGRVLDDDLDSAISYVGEDTGTY